MTVLDRPAEILSRLDPEARSVTEIPDLARQFLAATDDPEQARVWNLARRQCAGLLRQCEAVGYFATEDAQWDLDYVLDLLTDVLPEVEEEWEPEEVEGHGMRWQDFVVCGGVL